MRLLLTLAILAVGGIYAVFIYKEHSANIRREAGTPVVVNEPASPALSLEERAARAQGTTLPPEARRPPPPARVEEPVERADAAVPVAQYRCDGRVRCPEMHSCEEATWFLQNCPGTKMDGDGDGLPCEDQHCGKR